MLNGCSRKQLSGTKLKLLAIHIYNSGSKSFLAFSDTRFPLFFGHSKGPLPSLFHLTPHLLRLSSFSLFFLPVIFLLESTSICVLAVVYRTISVVPSLHHLQYCVEVPRSPTDSFQLRLSCRTIPKVYFRHEQIIHFLCEGRVLWIFLIHGWPQNKFTFAFNYFVNSAEPADILNWFSSVLSELF